MEKYDRGKVLASGAFGSVFIGTRLGDGMRVAIKRIFKTQRDGGVDISALRELYAHEEIIHDNICGIVDAFFDLKGETFLVYELMAGSVGDLLKQNDVIFTEGAIKAYAIQILKGLEYMHSVVSFFLSFFSL
jgi:serine/threonine protein kinase